MQNQKMNRQVEIKQKLEDILIDSEVGFEIFISMKSEKMLLKRFVIFEGDNTNFKHNIETAITNFIRENFISIDAEYVFTENIADNQKKIYIIEQNEDYNPFYLSTDICLMLENFNITERDDAQGILFCFSRNGVKLWAYQHIVPVTIPNKKKNNFLARMLSTEKGDIFVEMPDLLFPISTKINLLIINNYILTNDVKFLQRHFKFDDFINNAAKLVVDDIAMLGIIENAGILDEYIERSDRKYAKK